MAKETVKKEKNEIEKSKKSSSTRKKREYGKD